MVKTFLHDSSALVQEVSPGQHFVSTCTMHVVSHAINLCLPKAAYFSLDDRVSYSEGAFFTELRASAHCLRLPELSCLPQH